MDSGDWAMALEGDGEAFGRVFDRHRHRVQRHCMRLVPVDTDAADSVAIVFLEAWRNRARVRLVDGSLLPWLLVTATNVARNQTRGGGGGGGGGGARGGAAPPPPPPPPPPPRPARRGGGG
ncbi:RNA polymerase sigma factor, partial [Curtobacterium sp. CT11-133]|uniref:RNA polymerase sigma factor n=1 Tax=Curtobacterium sp. CT11-133 TaxID=3243014 RepID=UPI0039B01093